MLRVSCRGARTFTATAAQGLALMAEIVYIAASMRLPIVMFLSNRALSGPLSIWNDHSDTMMVRDSGWIQVFCENGQEVYDATFHAFRVAEDPKVSLPVMINVDGFVLTHVIEPIEFWTKEMVEKYLPHFQPSIAFIPIRWCPWARSACPKSMWNRKWRITSSYQFQADHRQSLGGTGRADRPEVLRRRNLPG